MLLYILAHYVDEDDGPRHFSFSGFLLLAVSALVGWAVRAFLKRFFRFSYDTLDTVAITAAIATASIILTLYAINPPRYSSWPHKATVEELQDAPVNINTATRKELETVPGVGRATSKRILENRPFSRIEDVTRLRGIRKENWERMRRCITVGDVAPQPTPAPKPSESAEAEDALGKLGAVERDKGAAAWGLCRQGEAGEEE